MTIKQVDFPHTTIMWDTDNPGGEHGVISLPQAVDDTHDYTVTSYESWHEWMSSQPYYIRSAARYSEAIDIATASIANQNERPVVTHPRPAGDGIYSVWVDPSDYLFDGSDLHVATITKIANLPPSRQYVVELYECEDDYDDGIYYDQVDAYTRDQAVAIAKDWILERGDYSWQ